ncbi:ATPase P-type K/Mg/Cd/Cu/Zn/Na/Ca/Na/H-transporter [Penicillium fimorum]|uniref:ATPase P-type K/Mg/Cd/Cu/Zn/Na/Ca/Na/H-transporter n=1 Tax=Penicillium fimorum TaxID=1882269 RepID=A0A9X0C433_9EURO|nr:ATPase P-type K/Mg/Cd/Cu/Zn/Na/Ca/Na/H-transporter [Penicillium fimorum]
MKSERFAFGRLPGRKTSIFDGHDVDKTAFDVDWWTNRSQETLGGVTDETVRVEDTVRVGVARPLSQ